MDPARLALGLALSSLPVAGICAETRTFTSSSQGMPLFGRLGSARLASLGGAFHSLQQGGDALLANPAGIASVEALQVGVHHESWLADISQQTLQAVTPLGPRRAFGAYVHVVDYGIFELRDANGARQGDMSARDHAIGVAFGMRSLLGFSGGVTLRGIRENLIHDDVFAVTIDAGAAWQGPAGWSGGLAVMNVGPAFAGFQGAESLRWGVARRFERNGNWLWPALAFSWEPKVAPNVHLGAELGLGRALALRAGYRHRFVETLLDGIQGLTLGMGALTGSFGFDYAFLPFGDLGAGHRVSLTWIQAPPRPRPATVASVGPIQAAVAPPQPDLVYVTDPLGPARSLESKGRLGEALAEYERVAQEHPAMAGAWRGLADLAYQMKLKEKALEAYQALLLIEDDPELAAWLKAYQDEP